ncbi:E1-E2 ATPase-domain-containing protein [Aspergillus pseudoustus]|uniref:E1-E2 ATPase-domain-containing protein n=1 Tax=Aspergillus pseudoustus TaxID=1810923 RepID=A0ABR4K1S7_9EURO
MTVVTGTFGLNHFDNKNQTCNNSAVFANNMAPEHKQMIIESVAINSTAFEGKENGTSEFIGSKTETALLEFARDVLGMASLAKERANASIIQPMPFDSSRKCIGAVNRLSNGTYRSLVKGACLMGGAALSKWACTTTQSAGDALYSDRKRVFGHNILPERRRKSLFHYTPVACENKMLWLLTIAAVILIAFGFQDSEGWERFGGVGILLAVSMVVLVSATFDMHEERRWKRLNKRKEDRLVKAVRSGKTTMISVHEILVGDVIHLEPGDVVPVDGIFINGHGVKCDESSATGESDPLRKVPAHEVYRAIEERHIRGKMDPFIISGAKVLEGVGTFLVTSVGPYSSYGRIMMSLREDDDVRTRDRWKDAALCMRILGLSLSAGLMLFAMIEATFHAWRDGAIDITKDIGRDCCHTFIGGLLIFYGLWTLPSDTKHVFDFAPRIVPIWDTYMSKASIFDRMGLLAKSGLNGHCKSWGDLLSLFQSKQKDCNGSPLTLPARHRRSRFVLPLRIAGAEIDALPDTGADENAISSACARLLGLKVERDAEGYGSSGTIFRLANGRVVKSCGVVSAPLSFSKGNNNKQKNLKAPVVFRVFNTLAVPMILGRKFLKDTETLTRYTNRLKKETTAPFGSSAIPRILHMNIAKERMLCYVNGVPVYANADTGAEMNLASPQWAKRHGGADIEKPRPGYEEVMLADGSRARILGQFNARFQVSGDPKAKRKGRSRTSTRQFFILDGLTSDVLLCQDLLFDVRAFQKQQKSFVVLSSPTAGSFSDVNFVAWLSKREKRLLGFFFKSRKNSNKNPDTETEADQSEAAFRAKVDEDDAREQHTHKYAKIAICQLLEPGRSMRLEAETRRHHRYLEDRAKREREHYAAAVARRDTVSSC